MFCKNCGNEVNPEWKFCPKCQGNLLENNQVSYNNQEMQNSQVGYNNQAMANNQISYNNQTMANNQIGYNNQAMANNQVGYNSQFMGSNQMPYNGQANVVNEEMANAIRQKNDKNIAIIIVVFLVTFLLTFTGLPGAEFAFIIALVDIVAGYIKYPQSRAIKVLFWLFIAFIILALILALFLIWTCNETLESCHG